MSNSIMTWNEFRNSNFPKRDYDYPHYEGRISGIIAAKVWGKSQNILLYIDTDEGENLKISGWDHDEDYMGMQSIGIGQHVLMTLAESRSGRIRVEDISAADDYADAADNEELG